MLEDTLHITLFEQLCERLLPDELRTLCFYLRRDFDDLPGDNKSAKLRELISLYMRRKQLVLLCHYVIRLRPDLESDLPALPPQFDENVTSPPNRLPIEEANSDLFEFDVFLSHNGNNKPAVRQLAEALKARGLKVWLDEEQLVPGRPWQEALEKIIQTAHTAAVLVGKDGFGPWELPEMRACLSQFVKRRMPVIPVLLPDASTRSELPLFLQELTWVDLGSGFTAEGLNQLIWGITGKKQSPCMVEWRDIVGSAQTYLDIATTELLPPPGIEHVLRNPAEMYLPLECTGMPGGAGKDAFHYIKEQLATRKALLIVGDYGTGKSFLVQKLFLDQAKVYRKQRCERLPILLPLKELHGMADDLALTKIVEQLRLRRFFDRSSLSPEEERTEVTRRLLAGEFLCILDGFDEIPLLAIRDDPLDEIRRLLECLEVGNNKIVITTRPGIIPAILTTDFAKRMPDLGLAYLLPWDPPEQHWRAYIDQCLCCGITFDLTAANFEEEVLSRLELRQLTVTPLYCQMLVETRDIVVQTQDLNVSKLYGIYTERYFTKVRERGLLRERISDPAKEICYKHDCLSATAVGMLKAKDLRQTKQQIEQSLSMIAERYDMHKLKLFVETETLVYSLLVPDVSNTYSFSHKSFYEYYVARKLHEELGLVKNRDSLLNTVLMPKEVITFLAGLMSDEDLFVAELAKAFASGKPLKALGLPDTRLIMLRNLALLQLGLTGRLECVMLKNLDFSGYQFTSGGQSVSLLKVSLDSCKMEGSSLAGVDLRGSSMRGIKLNQCVLDGADLRGVDLTGAFLNGVTCTDTRFSSATLSAVKLTERDAAGIKAAIYTEQQRYPKVVDKQWLDQTIRELDTNAV